MAHDAQLILAAGAVLAAGFAASSLAARLRLPALVLFVGLGMLIGSDGLGWIAFDDYRLARLIGTIALVLILFEGGLASGWGQIRPVLRSAVLLATLGTMITALIVGLAAAWLFGLSGREGLLLGSILAATDGAAVFALLRHVELPARVRRTIEGEAGLNDPVAVLLVLIMIELITTPHYHLGDAITFVVREVGVGVIVGLIGSVIVGSFARRTSHLPAGLASVGSLAAAALAYGAAGALHGSGFLAVYMVGLALGHQQHANHQALIAFHQGVASFAEIGMFFALGLLVYPSQFGAIALKALLLALITAVVARPIAVGLVTVRQGFSPPDRALIAWAGLRGAVPVILATFAVIQGVPRSLELLNIVFFAVLLSAALQGLTIQPVADRLRRADPNAPTDPRLVQG